MNVTFHALVGLSTATYLAGRMPEAPERSWLKKTGLITLAVGLGGNVLLHGLLDVARHQYPLGAATDIFLAGGLFLLALALVRPRFWPIYSACFLGCLLPDLVDLGPRLLNIAFHLGLPERNLFPWHWPRYSGSIYDGSDPLLSLVNHLLVLVGCLALVIGHWGGRSKLLRMSRPD